MYSRSHASIGYRRHGSRSSSRSSLKTQQEKKAALEKQQKLREARQTQMLFEVPSHFRCLRVVGKGAYGMVCEAIDRKAKKGDCVGGNASRPHSGPPPGHNRFRLPSRRGGEEISRIEMLCHSNISRVTATPLVCRCV